MERQSRRGGARKKVRLDDGSTLNGGARKGAGRRPVKVELRLGVMMGVCFDSVNVTQGEIYDIEQIGDRRVVRWKSDGGEVVVLSIPD